MAESENTKYEFTGDSTGLRAALDSAIDMLGKFETQMNHLATMGKVDISTTGLNAYTNSVNKVMTNLSKMETKLNGLGSSNVQLNPLATSYAQSSVTQLADALDYLQRSTSVTNKDINVMDIALKQCGKDMSKAASATKILTRETAKAHKDIDQVEVSSRKAGKAVSDMGDKAKKSAGQMSLMQAAGKGIKGALASLVSFQLGRFLSDSLKESISLIENMNLFSVAMGDSADQAGKFVNKFSDAMGMDPSVIMRYTGIFRQISESMGVAIGQADLLAYNFTKVGTDLASLFNDTEENAMEKLRSGLVGMSRPLREYGIVITQTALQDTAYSLGIDKKIKTMSEASKIGLRYITIMRQTSNAQGDFARTIESPANQLRIMSAQVVQLSRAIGNVLLTALGGVIPYINGFLMALTTGINYLATLMGFKLPKFDAPIKSGVSGLEDMEDALDNVGNSADKNKKKVKSMLGSIDELNILSDVDDSSGKDKDGLAGFGMGMDPAIAAAMEDYNNGMDKVDMKANKIRDAIASWFLPGTSLGDSLATLGRAFQTLYDSIFPPGAMEGIKTGFKNLGDACGKAFEAIMDFISGFILAFIGLVRGDLKMTLEGFKLMLGAVGKVVEAFFIALIGKDAVDAFKNWFKNNVGPWFTKERWLQLWKDVKTAWSDGWSSISTWWSTNITSWWNNNVAQWFTIARWLQLWTDVKKAWSDGWTKISDWWSTSTLGIWWDTHVSQWFTISRWSGLWTDVKQGIKDGWETVVTWWKENGASKWWDDHVSRWFSKETWSTALDGVKQAFHDKFGGIGDTIGEAMKGGMNVAIKAINRLIAGLNKFKIDIPDWIANIPGMDKYAGKSISFNIPSIKEFAQGGVVTGPTRALIGEGSYDEAVIPLGNSPQMQELVGQIANAVRDKGETIVKVLIGGKEWDSFTYQSGVRGKSLVGATPYGGGFNV